MIQKNYSSILLEKENIVTLCNKHPIVHILSGIYFVAFIISIGILFSLRSHIIVIIGDGLFWGGISIYSIIFLTFILISVLSDILDTLIITNTRIISIEKSPPFGREIRYIDYRDITELVSESKGILATLFSYGKISIGFQGGNQKLKFNFARKPSDVAKILHEEKEKISKDEEKVA